MSERNLNEDQTQKLLDLYSKEGNERVGFIVDDEIVEVENLHPDPRKYFDVSIEDIEKYELISWAIWHSQPMTTSQLSYEDYAGFVNFPEHKHIVIGSDGLRIYRVKNGAVVKDSLVIRQA